MIDSIECSCMRDGFQRYHYYCCVKLSFTFNVLFSLNLNQSTFIAFVAVGVSIPVIGKKRSTVILIGVTKRGFQVPVKLNFHVFWVL